AMPNGGTLTIETRDVSAADGQMGRSGVGPGSYVMLSVSDTGVGMDKRTQERVFEPFFTTKEVGKGTGLGLAIVYSTVEEAGGHIVLHSQPGKGTTLRIYFPRANNDQPEETAPEPAQSIRGTETILQAEDEPTIRDLVRTGLEQYGYRVLSAADCRAVL